MSPRLSTSPGLPRLAQHPWILRSKGRARLFAVFAGVLVGFGTSVSEWFFYKAGESPLMMMIASDVFAALLAALLIAGVLGKIVDRNEALRSQLEMIGQINHHVRNGLQLIAFSAYHTHDQEAIATIRLGTERIEWALREMLDPGALDMPGARHLSPSRHPPGQRSA